MSDRVATSCRAGRSSVWRSRAALVKKPPVLLLDEATSALDNKSEKVVQAALDEIMTKQKRTTVVIAHRLSTIRNADKIAVLDGGKVVEEGAYDELIGKGGLFHTLAQKQEALLAQDKKAVVEATVVGAAGAAADDDDDDSPVIEATVVDVAAAEDDVAVSKKKGKKKKKDKGEEEEKTAVFGPLLAMQTAQLPVMGLMMATMLFACATSTIAFYLMVEVMGMLYKPDPAEMRSDALRLSVILAAMAGAIIAAFTVGGWANGTAGSALTSKLRGKGISALLRQEIGFFDADENSATELTAFLAEKVSKVKTITTEQLDLVAQLIGGIGAFIFVIARYSDWRLLLMWIVCIVIMSAVIPVQTAFMTGATDETRRRRRRRRQEQEDARERVGQQARRRGRDGDPHDRVANLEQVFYEFAKSTATVAYIQKRDSCVAGFFIGSTMAIMMVAFGGIMFYSVWLGNEGRRRTEKALAPMFAVMGVMVPMMKAAALADSQVGDGLRDAPLQALQPRPRHRQPERRRGGGRA